MGHEIAGKVDDIGPVLVYASWGCGSCPFCTRGEEQLCEEGEAAGWDRDGGYTEYVRVPSRRYLIPLGDLDPVHPAPLADAGVTPYRVVRLSPPWLQDPGAVLVIGSGGLGQFAIQYLRLLASAHVVAIDPLPDKRKRARALGAHETFGSSGKTGVPLRIV